MKICIFTNSAGEQIAVIVPIKSICTTDANGILTVIFPDGTSFIVPAYASEGIFYTSDHDPVIIVPYYNSTVTFDPGNGYTVTYSDGRVYFLPIPGRGDPFFWLFPHNPLPIAELLLPVVPPDNTSSYVFTNAYGEEIIIIAPWGSHFLLNSDGSVTITFQDGSQYTVPFTATNFSADSLHGYHVIVVPNRGTTIMNYGFGYMITLPDGSTRWDNRIYYIFQQPPVRPSLPPELEGVEERYTNRLFGYPTDDITYVVGVLGIIAMPDGQGTIWIVFPDGFTTSLLEPLVPGAYSAQRWVDTPTPGHWVTYHWAVVLPGSTVTSLGNGWYHVEPPAGSGGQAFDFQSP